jgi:hypothetical protein
VADIRDPSLLVHDQVLDQVEVLGLSLKGQAGGRVAVGATIVHVHVQIGAEPAGRRQVRQTVQHHPE